MYSLKGQKLNLNEKGPPITIHWKQGSFFGIGGERSQTYFTCQYVTNIGLIIPIYIQSSYDIPEILTIDSRLQYGEQEGTLFFVLHNQEQKPFQQRFRGSTGLVPWASGDYLINV